MQVAVRNTHLYFPAFLFPDESGPKEKLQKKRGQAKMLPYTLAGARPLLPEAIPRLTLDMQALDNQCLVFRDALNPHCSYPLISNCL